MGIRTKFVAIITLLSLLATLAIGYTSYELSTRNALAEAKSKGEIIYNYMQSSGKFFGQYQYPIIMEQNSDKDRFVPELMSKFVVNRMEFEIFQETLEGYFFKQATLDPLWPDNKANKDEENLITYFSNNPAATKKQGIMKRDGGDFFYTARPIKIEEKFCLTCHGKPADAPADQRDIYGTENGYNWVFGSTVGTSIIYISISEAMEGAMKSTIKIFTVGILCLLMIIVCIWIFLDRAVVTPIVNLSESAKNLSVGKNLNNSINVPSKDEVGNLAESIDRMRISVNILLKRRK